MAANSTNAPITTETLFWITLPNNDRYFSSSFSRKLDSSTANLLVASKLVFSSLKNRDVIIGIRVKAINEETVSEKEIVSAKSLNKNPAIPGTNRMGKNTTSVVKVETTTGTATSLAPKIEAVFRSEPSSRNRNMFSNTTTASSTTIPTARVKPDKEMILRLKSAKSITMNVVMMETGIDIAIMRAERPLRKKARSISTTKITA